MREILILGGGFTGGRVAERLRQRGERVLATHRSQIDFTQPDASRQLIALASPGCIVLHSIPSLENGADAQLLESLRGRAARVVYLSTTGVYGDTEMVDASTPVAAGNARQRARVATEEAVQNGPWQALILRPAAIYGPGRGVQVAMRLGTFQLLGDGSNYVSRIHVDDLAAIAEAAVLSDLVGAFPVADAHPCPSREIAEFCSRLLGVPMASSAPVEQLAESRTSNRRVDGEAIRKALGITLRYPSYHSGIPASL